MDENIKVPTQNESTPIKRKPYSRIGGIIVSLISIFYVLYSVGIEYFGNVDWSCGEVSPAYPFITVFFLLAIAITPIILTIVRQNIVALLLSCISLYGIFEGWRAIEPYDHSSWKYVIRDNISNLVADAFQYKIRPTTMGGGGGSYTGWRFPSWGMNNCSSSQLTSNDGKTLVFKGTSKYDSTLFVEISVDSTGSLQVVNESGWMRWQR